MNIHGLLKYIEDRQGEEHENYDLQRLSLWLGLNTLNLRTQQLISNKGRIITPKIAWLIRCCAVSVVIFLSYKITEYAVQTQDWLILFTLFLPYHTITVMIVGWFFYKDPSHHITSIEDQRKRKISVIIPVYNQANMIRLTITAIRQSTYKNIEIVSVNDGSTDNSLEILEELRKTENRLIVVNKKNEGKRKAVSDGFRHTTGDYVVLIDSDSIIHPQALEQIVKTFEGDEKVGAIVGHVKVWNSYRNVLTKCQDCWYDYSFNIQKACESVFGSVTCCSGCIAGYRKSILMDFMPYWSSSTVDCSDDRELTSFILAGKTSKNSLKGTTPLGKMERIELGLKNHVSKYDDSDDRALTAVSLSNRQKSVYVASAICYTAVPDNIKQFAKQQERWKKGYLRTNFWVSTFFWKRNPIMAALYYSEYACSFITPLIAFAILVYQPLMHAWWVPLTYVGLILLKGVFLGLDYRLRDKSSKYWYWKPVMQLLSVFVLSWMLFPALMHIRNNRWGTR